MKRALHLCFSSYGRVLDVVCLKTTKQRGQARRALAALGCGALTEATIVQAWVVFSDVPAATNALRGMQGFNFYDRPLVRQARRRALLPRTSHAACACAAPRVCARHVGRGCKGGRLVAPAGQARQGCARRRCVR